MRNVSEMDRKILMALQADATETLKVLADRLAMSQATVWRRIQDLEADRVITGRVALVDPRRVGLNVCVFVHVNLKDHSVEARAEFDAFVTAHAEVVECYSVTGAQDYVLIVRTEDVDTFERFLMHHLLAHPRVATASSNLALREVKYSTALPL